MKHTDASLVKLTEDITLTIRSLTYIPLLLAMPLLMQAGPVWFTGTPADASTLPDTPALPQLGGVLINFDSLAQCPTFPPSGCTNYSGNTFSGVTISSPDGLYAIPFSAQTAPNELFDNSAEGSANITVMTAGGETAFGVGIADSDPVTITLQALGAGGVALGAPDVITITETGGNPGNGYYYVTDTSADLFGFTITQSVSDPSFSGLAIDDVQAATPEPSTLLLLSAGAAIFAVRRLRKRA
jgi:PEP-CTERM motif